MFKISSRPTGSIVSYVMLAACLTMSASAQQQTPVFTPGNLVVVVEGCGVHGGTCTAVKNGTGSGAGNSSVDGYGDNQAAPVTLFQYAPNGTASATYVNSLVLPQTGSGANLAVSGEYGSSSEGMLQLSGTGQYLTLMGYGIDAPTFNAAYYPNPGFTGDPYGAAPSGALAQSGSLTGQSYTAVPRVVTLIDAYGNTNSSTALYNVFSTNNPRSIYTADGSTSAYVSGQGSGCDATGGVFYTKLGAPNTAPVAITGIDAASNSSCSISPAQDTRSVQIYNNTLYVSVDSTEGKSFNRSFIGTLGTPPATTLYVPSASTPYATGPTMLAGFGNTGGTGKETITTGIAGNGNGLNAGLQVNLSPVSYFFASPSVLYVTDTGNPKQSSANSPLGDGGLQKWINSQPDGTGTWSLAYTLYQGLNLVQNPTANPSNISGATGLYGLAGTVSNGVAHLYVTNYNIADLDPTSLYGISDTLSTTTNPGTSFSLLDTAPADSNFKGVSFAPSLPAGSATITSSPSGLAFTSTGTGCAPGTYTTPVTLIWTPGSSCTLSVTSPQAGPAGTQYAFSQWQDGTTGTSETVTAPATSAIYNASFNTTYQLTTSATTGGTVSAGGYILANTNAIVTATPSSGYYFVNFTGTTTSTSNPLTLPMTGPQSVAANFSPQIQPTVTFTGAPASAPVSSTFVVSATTNSGATATITASGACSIAGTAVTMTASTGTCMLTASWPAVAQYLAATATQSTVAQPLTPVVALAPTSLTFPGQQINTTSSAQIVTLTNSGKAPLSITSIAATGNFVQTNTCGNSVAAGANCLISVTFAPSTAGPLSGVLTVVDNASGSPQTVPLSGTGESLVLASSSTSLTISSPGGSASTPIQISQAGGFSGTVNLTCAVAYTGTGTPNAAPTCSLNPAQVQLSGSSATNSTLTISSTANPSSLRSFPLGGGTALAALLAFAIAPRKKWRGSLLMAVLCTVGLVTMLIGCGGSSSSNTSGASGTTTGSYSVTVTAASGSATTSTVVSLTVQ